MLNCSQIYRVFISFIFLGLLFVQVYIVINFLLTIVYALILHSKADYHSCASFSVLIQKDEWQNVLIVNCTFLLICEEGIGNQN